jgi:D-alanyl-D-alanine carboxypeptidase
MQGITALSGYLATRDHQPLLFVILINGFSDANQKYQNLQDQICQYLGQVSLSN